ncbi:FapA family protein [Desulfobacter vibrioformis]|uniref:FapA family protein n=1 Tax=Desulfobacter vibrioformis TaxID=34031 RepID=UPI000558EDF4|nr:FapA family protein [Desulfobacter vibrioformis]
MLEKLALQKKFITKAQCSQALEACRGADNLDLALKNYFEKENILTDKQMKALLATYSALKIIQKSQVFGNSAVDLGFASKEQFLQEMARQKKKIAENRQPEFIGKIWVQDQTLTQEQYQEIIQPLRKVQPAQGPARASKPLADPGAEQPGAEQIDYSLTRELACGVMLEVDVSGMTAFIRKTGKFKDTVTAAEIMEQLEDNGIVYGLVEPFEVEKFIASSEFRTRPFRIAKGTDPVPGKNARIEYFFDTDPLKAVGIDEDGNMDFKDRGPIPWVKKGCLLAKKFPMTEASEGRNVFDQVIPGPAVADRPLKSGTGVVCASGGLEAYAQISGTPSLDQSGKIQIRGTFTVPTDVSFETGNINYNGDIVIKGTLKAGFKAMGHVIHVGTVDGGKIHATGDVTVSNGMISGNVYARGNVSIGFVQNATIYCLGNLFVDKEILDSRIITSGAVMIKTGEIISSDITCNKGLFAQHLGTEKSVPNIVTFGVDTFTDRELKSISNQIEHIMERQEKIHEELDSLSKEIFRRTANTLRLVHEIDHARQENFLLSKSPGASSARGLKSQIQVNKRLLVRLDKELNQMLDRIEEKKSQREKFKVEAAQLENTLEKLRSEQGNFTQWKQHNPGVAQAVVSGRVIPGTMINGPDVSMEILEIRNNVKIFQTRVTTGGDTASGIDIVDNTNRK